MNWLAHTFLSELDIQHQLGNLLSDHLKGKIIDKSNAKFNAGISLHKQIDSFTDNHEIFIDSKMRLGDKKYLKGVIIDITYDHFLAKNWETYATCSLNDFLTDLHSKAFSIKHTLSPRAEDFINKVIGSFWLERYKTTDGLFHSISMIDKRLSKALIKREKASDYIPIIEKELENLEQDFHDFFPHLLSFVRSKVNTKQLNHWK